MAIVSKQIGQSQESNLLWEILKETNKLSGIMSNNLSPFGKDNPCYTEFLFTSGGPNVSNLNSYLEIIDSTSVFPIGIDILDALGNVIGWRLYGGKNLKVIDFAFASNTSIYSINDPCKLITLLGQESFNDANKLQYVNLPGIEIIDSVGVFTNCTQLKLINLPNLKTITGNSNFSVCSSLTNVTFPKLTSIVGSENFKGSNIVNVNFPLLTSITGSENFRSVSNLTVIYFPNCSTIGASGDCGNDYLNFLEISSATITLTIKSSLITCDAGNPNADVQYLIDNNTVTLITT